jgi:hypothetical protein
MDLWWFNKDFDGEGFYSLPLLFSLGDYMKAIQILLCTLLILALVAGCGSTESMPADEQAAASDGQSTSSDDSVVDTTSTPATSDSLADDLVSMDDALGIDELDSLDEDFAEFDELSLE